MSNSNHQTLIHMSSWLSYWKYLYNSIENDVDKRAEWTHFVPLVSFYTPWKQKKISYILMFPGVIETD